MIRLGLRALARTRGARHRIELALWLLQLELELRSLERRVGRHRGPGGVG